MKKFISFVLIAALVATCAFAEATFAGNASLAFGGNWKTEERGFTNSKEAKVSLAFEAGTPEKAGEGDFRAEIAGKFDLKIKEGADDFSASITKANVIVKDVTVGILSAGGDYNMASSYWTINDDGDLYEGTRATKAYADGFTVSYDKFTAGFGYKHTAGKAAVALVPDVTTEPTTVETTDGQLLIIGVGVPVVKTAAADAVAETVKAVVNFNTADIEVAEDVTVKAAAQYRYTEDVTAEKKTNDVYAGVATTAKVDELTVTAGADVAYGITSEKVAADFAATVAYAPVKVEFYGETAFKDKTTKLNVKVSGTCPVTEEVSVTAYADLRNICVEKEMKVEAGASVAYKAEQFTAKAGLNYAKVLEVEKTNQIWASASIESTTLVDGATLSLAYAANSKSGVVSTNLLKDQKVKQEFGKLTATAKIAF